jgi:hypothetical protein
MGFSPGSVSFKSKEDIFYGEWPRIYAITDPQDDGLKAERYLGAIKSATLRTTREELKVMGTTFPAKLEMSAPVNVEMQFAGTAYELTYGLLHFLTGDARIDSEDHYINPGAACAFGDIDVTLRGERKNCDDHMIVFQIHRARASGAMELGSAPNDAVGTPVEVNALNDENGEFGGSASSPLGWIWLSHDAVAGA